MKKNKTASRPQTIKQRVKRLLRSLDKTQERVLKLQVDMQATSNKVSDLQKMCQHDFTPPPGVYRHLHKVCNVCGFETQTY